MEENEKKTENISAEQNSESRDGYHSKQLYGHLNTTGFLQGSNSMKIFNIIYL